MTPAQERKFDDLYKTVLEIQGEMKVYVEKHSNLLNGTIANSKDISEIKDAIVQYKADRNKALGVGIAAGILGTITGIGTAIYELFFKHS